VELLRNSLQNDFLFEKPEGFTVLDGSSEFQVGKLTVLNNQLVDSNGNFSVSGEAFLRTIVFRNDDLKSLLSSLKDKKYSGLSFDNLKINFGDIKTDFKKGELTFNLKAEGFLKPDFSAENFKREILGKNVNDVQLILLKITDFEDAKVSLWPFWLKTIPSNLSKVNVLTN